MAQFDIPEKNNKMIYLAFSQKSYHHHLGLQMPIPLLSKHTTRAGFTLVELSIVLFIIGIIMASVMKGQDIIASARVTKVQQGYFLKWLEIVNGYHEVTGRVLCDGVENGGPSVSLGTEDGFMDGITYDDNTSSRQSVLLKRLKQTGIDACSNINGNLFDLDITDKCDNDLNVYEYMINSENIGKQKIALGLTSFEADLDSEDAANPTVHRNFIIFLNIPLDYAIRLDKLIDGYADGKHGKCLNFSSNSGKGRNIGNPYPDLTTAGLRPTSSSTPTSRTWPGANNNSDSIDNLFALGIMLDY